MSADSFEPLTFRQEFDAATGTRMVSVDLPFPKAVLIEDALLQAADPEFVQGEE